MRVFAGTGGNDRIHGTNGRDVLVGLDGNDTLIGGNGRDQLWGGAGSDTFVVAPEQVDTIMDFGPGDRIVIDTNRLTEDVDHSIYNIPSVQDVYYSLGARLHYSGGQVQSLTWTGNGELYYRHHLIAEVHGDTSAVRWEFYDHAL